MKKHVNKILVLFLTVILLLGSATPQMLISATDTVSTNSVSLSAINGSVSGAGNNVINNKFKATPVDASQIDNPYLKISIYLTRNDDETADISNLAKGHLELNSSGSTDQAEIYWSVSNFGLTAGWNTIYLPFTDGTLASTTDEVFDISAIKYFRIYTLLAVADKTIEYTLKVKDASIVSGCNLPISLPIEGSSSGAGKRVIEYKYFSVDASNITDPHLKISIYIARNDDESADISDLLKDGQIELSSSGKCDLAEIAWGTTALNLEAGWNTVYLPFSQASATSGGTDFDKSAINYFRIYHRPVDTTIEFTLKIKDASIVAGTNLPISLPIEGSSSGVGGRVIQYKNFSADASKIDDPHLKISIYIARNDDESADISDLLKSGQIELSSSGKCDLAEIAWGTTALNLEAGWNTVYLPFSQASATSGGTDFDISAINYFRIYNNPVDTAIEYTLRVKNISIISGNNMDDSTELYLPEDFSFAKLNGTENNICHPGLSGEFNSGSYEGSHFDRRLSFNPSGDIKDNAYVLRTAVSGMEAVDLGEYNTFTFDLLVEDNGAWEEYKDSLSFYFMKNSNISFPISDNALKNALKDVVPGVKTKITLSLCSLGQKKLSSIGGFKIKLNDGESDKILHLTITNAVAKFNADYPPVIYDVSRADMQVSQKVFLIDELGIRGKLGNSATDTYQALADTFARNADSDDVVFNGDISETEFISFKLYINEISALPSDLFVAFGYTATEGIQYLNNIDISSQITQSGWNTITIQTGDVGASEFLSDISAWKIFTNDNSVLGENYKVILYACNFAGVEFDIVPTLTVGNNETEMYVTWFTTSEEVGSVVLKQANEEIVIDAYEQGASTADFYYYNRAKITGLKANTEYTYKVGTQEAWSDEYTLSTSDFDSSFNFIHVSDIQFAGGQTQVDNWNKALNNIKNHFPNTSFILNTGDVSDIKTRNDLYLLYKSPELLKSYITAVVPGNHDNYPNGLFNEHFTIPESKETYTGYGVNDCDYWYGYNNVLFISLNNNISNNDYHEAFVRKVVSEQGNNYDWKIVTTHFSAFSATYHANESVTIKYREQLAPVFSELKIDAVLSGHDHCYDRSYIMNGLTPIVSDGVYAANTDGGVLYISGTTASASKYNSPVSGIEEYSAKVIKSTYGFVNCEVAAGRLIFTFYNGANMEILDKFTLYKDAQVSAADLVVLRKGLLQSTNEADLYDYNYDSEINIIDLVRLKKRLANVA